jgi:hypothetical protein
VEWEREETDWDSLKDLNQTKRNLEGNHHKISKKLAAFWGKLLTDLIRLRLKMMIIKIINIIIRLKDPIVKSIRKEAFHQSKVNMLKEIDHI